MKKAIVTGSCGFTRTCLTKTLVDRGVTEKPFQKIGSGTVRLGDRPYFVVDLDWTKGKGLDWKPKMGVDEGVRFMIDWIGSNLPLIKNLVAMRMS